MAKGFSATVDKWTRKTEARTEAVFKQSAQALFEQAQTTVNEGGKLRIDTGFLRYSFSTSLSGPPTGPSINPYESGSQQADWNSADTVLTINGAKLGDSIWGGWTASYARVREMETGSCAALPKTGKPSSNKQPQRLKRGSANACFLPIWHRSRH